MEDVPKFSNPDAYTFSSAVSIDIPTEIVSSTNNVKPGQQVYVLAGQATHRTNKEEFLLVWFGSVVGKGKTGRKLRVKHPNESTVWEYSLDKVLLETQANFLEASEVLIPSDYSQGEETEEEPEEASKEKDSAPKLRKKRGQGAAVRRVRLPEEELTKLCNTLETASEGQEFSFLEEAFSKVVVKDLQVIASRFGLPSYSSKSISDLKTLLINRVKAGPIRVQPLFTPSLSSVSFTPVDISQVSYNLTVTM